MLGLFGEGLTTALFPCSLVLAVPGLAIAAGGRRHSAHATAAFLAGLLASSWLRFAGVTDLWPNVVTGLLFVLGSLGIVVAGRWRPVVAVAGAGLAAGSAAGVLWRPCVGTEFGDLVNRLEASRLLGGFGLAVYIVGVMTPIIAVAAGISALPSEWIDKGSRPLVWLGGAVLGLLGLATLAGLDDVVISRLYELSSF